ncbi:MAG: hypothetical protein WCA16_20215 [Candidatus Sulfotelmatobacter sp.]
MLLGDVSRSLGLFPFLTCVNSLRIVTLKHLLDALDRAVPLADQIFIGGDGAVPARASDGRRNMAIVLKTPQ